jgi:uncharacterized protein (TIGR02301 family)
MRRFAILAALLVVLPTAALAQERDPAARQAVVDLAYVLGQAHALTQLCDPGDQHWRSHMLAMVETEGDDHAFAERLRGQFNTGYLSGQQQFTSCSPESRRAQSQVAARGAAIAKRLGQARVPQAPTDSLAPP